MAGTTPEVQRIITLSSGASRGSNLLAIHRYFIQNYLPVTISCAVFSNPDSPALGICRELGIPTEMIPIQDMTAFENRILELIHSRNIALVALCGFMRKLSKWFLDEAGIPVLNIHPALLPAYGGKGMYGMNVHQAVFAAGEAVSGASVHIVNAQYDRGPVISQKVVDISQCKCAEDIAEMVLKIEHQIYAPAIYEALKKA